MSRILHGMNPGSPKYCGLEILSGSHLPEDWRGNLITNDFRGHRVCRFVLKDDGSTYASQEKTELIKSDHPAFRPIDVKMGPDGAIYVADWYNPIIQHGEIDFRDPRRDHTHGRIWRITAKGRPLGKKPDFAKMTMVELLDQLKSPEDWNRAMVKRVLKERGAKAYLEFHEFDKWFEGLDPKSPDHGRHLLEFLWVQQSLDIVQRSFLMAILSDEQGDGRVRAAAIRVLSQLIGRTTKGDDYFGLRLNNSQPIKADEILYKLIEDKHPRVRLEAVRALAQLKTAKAAEAALSALDKPMDRVLDYALWLTLNDLEPQWLPAFKAGTLSFQNDPKKLMFALSAAGTSVSPASIMKMLENKDLKPDQAQAFWLLLAQVGGPEELGRILRQASKIWKDVPARDSLLSAVANAVRERKVAAPKSVLVDLRDLMLAPAAVDLVGLWKVTELRNVIEEHAQNPDIPEESQRACFATLMKLDGPAASKTLDEISRSKDNRTRRLAIEALAAVDPPLAAARALEYLALAKNDDEISSLFAAFLSRKGGSVALTNSLNGKKLPPDVAKIGIRAVRASTLDLPTLVEALTKAGDLAAPKRDLTKPELDALVGDVIKTGNAARGELLYRRNDLQCLNCHAIGGAGGQVGPDLASIGASAPVDYLVESLLIPTKAVKEGFHSVRVETVDGKVYTGIKVRESKTELAIRTAEDKEIVIQVKDIEDNRASRSLMPDGLVDTLTRSELIDLVKFLSELGKVGPYSLSKTRVVRRWQILQPTPEALDLIRRTRIAAAAGTDPAFVWQSAYTLVSGELPFDGAASFALSKDTPALSVFRCQLDVTAPGRVKLKMNSATGIRLFVGNNQVDLSDETALDLPSGTQTLMFAVEASKRKEPLRVELEDVKDSPARVTIVGGK